MKACIHRGAKQIGGSCVEIHAQGHRLILDAGMPLDVATPADARLPDTLDLSGKAPPLTGVVISHPHQDHYGLASLFPADTTYLIGEYAHRILQVAAAFTPAGARFKNVIHLKHCQPTRLGPFTITPRLVDHSAYDAYAIHVQADGKGLFYTGDLRAHGRKGQTFQWLLDDPPTPVDVLLMEGTTIQREGTERGFPTERDLEKDLVRIFKETPGMPLVWCSGQGIDRLVTVFRAAKRAGRQLILDLYAAHILEATGNPRVPHAEWDGVRVFLPRSQKMRIKQDELFHLADVYRAFRIFPEHLAVVAQRSVMLFRPNMRKDLELAGCLDGACLVYSMWDGYLKQEGMKPFLAWLKERGIPLHKCHTSGHASLRDLKRLRAAFPDAVVVPIHTQQPGAYKEMFGRVAQHRDGEWWDV